MMRHVFSATVNLGWLAYFCWVFWRYPSLTHEQLNHAHAFLFLEAFAITLLPLALLCLFGVRKNVRQRSGWGLAGSLQLFGAVVGTAVFLSRDLSLWRGGGWLAGAVVVLLGTRLIELLVAGRRPLRAAVHFMALCAFPASIVILTVPLLEFAFIGPESAMHLMLIQGGVIYFLAVLLYRLAERRGRQWINPFHPRGRSRRAFTAALLLLVLIVAARSDGYRLTKAEQEAHRKSRAQPSRHEYLRSEITAVLTILLAVSGVACLARGVELQQRVEQRALDVGGGGPGDGAAEGAASRPRPPQFASSEK